MTALIQAHPFAASLIATVLGVGLGALMLWLTKARELVMRCPHCGKPFYSEQMEGGLCLKCFDRELHNLRLESAENDARIDSTNWGTE